jgi:hypothetical protein
MAKRKLTARRQYAGFYKGFGNFFFGRFGHWTVSDCEECGVSVSINFLKQKYLSVMRNTRAKLPDIANMVFTQILVKFSSSHRVFLPDYF